MSTKVALRDVFRVQGEITFRLDLVVIVLRTAMVPIRILVVSFILSSSESADPLAWQKFFLGLFIIGDNIHPVLKCSEIDHSLVELTTPVLLGQGSNRRIAILIDEPGNPVRAVHLLRY